MTTIEFNLRFLGQYFDNESNLHYNYYRTYNPKTGKYISSDPLGLNAGTNTYGYVNGNSLSRIDPLGLVDDFVKNSLTPRLTIFGNAETKMNYNEAYYFEGTLKTSMGRRIFASQFSHMGVTNFIGRNINNFGADCHGWSFTNGKY